MQEQVITMTVSELQAKLKEIAEEAAIKTLSMLPKQPEHQPSAKWYGKLRETREKYFKCPDGLIRKVYSSREANKIWDNLRQMSCVYAGAKRIDDLSLEQADVAGEFAEKVCEMLMEKKGNLNDPTNTSD